VKGGVCEVVCERCCVGLFKSKRTISNESKQRRAVEYVKEQMYLCGLRSCVHIIVSNECQKDDEVEVWSEVDDTCINNSSGATCMHVPTHVSHACTSPHMSLTRQQELSRYMLQHQLSS
jgi:hypothetical protein